jgi:hypothetical protein
MIVFPMGETISRRVYSDYGFAYNPAQDSCADAHIVY